MTTRGASERGPHRHGEQTGSRERESPRSPHWARSRALGVALLGCILVAGCRLKDSPRTTPAEDSTPAPAPAPAPRSVEIQNFVGRLVARQRCRLASGDATDCGDYRLTFVLSNGFAERIRRLEEIELEVGATTLRTGYQPCSSDPWLVYGEGASSVIDIEVAATVPTADGGTPELPAYRPSLTIPCGYRKSLTQELPTDELLPLAGPLRLRLWVLLADGSRRSAEASTDLIDMQP